MNEKMAQVAKQCDAVAHMARAIAQVHEEKSGLFRGDREPTITDLVGRETHRLMETLGDILNGMDACTDEDAWIDPVFTEARRQFPLPSEDSEG